MNSINLHPTPNAAGANSIETCMQQRVHQGARSTQVQDFQVHLSSCFSFVTATILVVAYTWSISFDFNILTPMTSTLYFQKKWSQWLLLEKGSCCSCLYLFTFFQYIDFFSILQRKGKRKGVLVCLRFATCLPIPGLALALSDKNGGFSS